MFFGSKDKTLLKQLLEQEKLINRLKAVLDQQKDEYLKLVEEFRRYREEHKPKVWIAEEGQPPRPQATNVPIHRINYPQDRVVGGPEPSKERLVEIFGDPGMKKYGN